MPTPPPPPPFSTQDATEALDALSHAPDHGFQARRFPAAEIERRLGSTNPAERADGLHLLRAAVLDYARAQHGLTIPLGALPRAWNQRPSRYDAAAELDAALRAGALQAWLDGLPPPTPEYRALQAAYVAASGHHPDRARPRVEAAPLDLGDQDARTRALRERLALEGDGLTDADADAPVDQDLTDTLRAYQGRHGLEQTGVLDEATVARLNAPVASKAAKLRVNMERLRWLPRPQPSSRIDVNIASAELTYLRDGEPETHMLAVSGKLGDETPMVSSAIDSIVLNPPWYVPDDIARREIVPKGAALHARPPLRLAWRAADPAARTQGRARTGQVRLPQPLRRLPARHAVQGELRPGPSARRATAACACSTPWNWPSSWPRRSPASPPSASTRRWRRAGRCASSSGRPLPVRLLYLTAEPKGDGVAYLPDVYGWDARAVGAARPLLRARRCWDPRVWPPPSGGQARGGRAPSVGRRG